MDLCSAWTKRGSSLIKKMTNYLSLGTLISLYEVVDINLLCRLLRILCKSYHAMSLEHSATCRLLTGKWSLTIWCYKDEVTGHWSCWPLTHPERSSVQRSGKRPFKVCPENRALPSRAVGKTGRMCLQIVRPLQEKIRRAILASPHVWKSTNITNGDICSSW